MRKVNTDRFGEIEIDEKRIVHFKDGIPAFEDEHEFIILPYVLYAVSQQAGFGISLDDTGYFLHGLFR